MKKKNLWKLALAAVVAAAIAAAVIVPQVSAQRKERALQEQLDLGAKYLDELDYEQALDAYQAAVEIDESCAEAYVGESYAYEGLEDVESAIDILLTAEEKLQDERINVRKEELFDGQIAAGKDALSLSHFEDARMAYRLAGKIQIDGAALEGLVNVYVTWVNALAEKPDYEEAFAILEEGIKETDAEELKALRNQLLEKQKEYEEEQERLALVQPLMEEIAGYIQAENYAAVGECQNRQSYRDFVASDKAQTIFDTPSGKLGIYDEGFYLGDYSGNQREGNGIWLWVSGENMGIAEGQWRGDAPNGEQKYVYRTISGNFYSSYEGISQNGIWTGEVITSCKSKDVGKSTWRLYAKNGRWETYGTNKNGVIVSKEPVLSERSVSDLTFQSADDSIAIFGF